MNARFYHSGKHLVWDWPARLGHQIKFFFQILRYKTILKNFRQFWGKKKIISIVKLVKYFVKWIYSINFTKYFSRVACALAQCEKMNNLVSPMKYFFKLPNSLVKTLISRNVCQKCVKLSRNNFHTVPQCGVYDIFASPEIYFVKSIIQPWTRVSLQDY